MIDVLALFQEKSAAARILSKEFMRDNITTACMIDGLDVRMQWKWVIEEKEAKLVTVDQIAEMAEVEKDSIFDQALCSIPIIKEALEFTENFKSEKSQPSDPLLLNM